MEPAMNARWSEYSQRAGYQLAQLPISQELLPKQDGKIRIVCISDTHSVVETFEPPLEVPDGDILVHAGDFSHRGRVPEIQAFNAWLAKLPHRHKVVVAGNHEIGLDAGTRTTKWHEDHPDLDRAASFLTGCVLLHDSAVDILGLKFYGCPWTPKHRGMAFNVERGSAIAAKWALIPDDVDVLVTHAPPLGVLDLCHHGERAGCEDLLRAVVDRIKPKLHVFGHVHEGHGMATNGTTVFVNAATCARKKVSLNRPIVIDLEARTDTD